MTTHNAVCHQSHHKEESRKPEKKLCNTEWVQKTRLHTLSSDMKHTKTQNATMCENLKNAVKYHKFEQFPNATNVKISHTDGGKKSTVVLG